MSVSTLQELFSWSFANRLFFNLQETEWKYDPKIPGIHYERAQQRLTFPFPFVHQLTAVAKIRKPVVHKILKTTQRKIEKWNERENQTSEESFLITSKGFNQQDEGNAEPLRPFQTNNRCPKEEKSVEMNTAVVQVSKPVWNSRH